jgi:molybdopterin-guanine dinucleotide biosynthesis protein B
MHELRGTPEPSLAELLRRLSPVDLVIVEGFKREAHPKIEVHRAANRKPFLFRELVNVGAILSDVPLPQAPVPVIGLDDVQAVADQLLELAEPVGSVLSELERTAGADAALRRS